MQKCNKQKKKMKMKSHLITITCEINRSYVFILNRLVSIAIAVVMFVIQILLCQCKCIPDICLVFFSLFGWIKIRFDQAFHISTQSGGLPFPSISSLAIHGKLTSNIFLNKLKMNVVLIRNKCEMVINKLYSAYDLWIILSFSRYCILLHTQTVGSAVAPHCASSINTPCEW